MCNEKLLVANYIVCTLVPMEVDMQIIEVGKDAKKTYLEGHEVYSHRYGDNIMLEMIVQSEGYVDRRLCRPKVMSTEGYVD